MFYKYNSNKSNPKGRMHMKRKLSAAIAALLVASLAISAAPAAYAETASASTSVTAESASEDSSTNNSDDMKAALTIVKSRYDIPEEYTVFDYSASKYRGRKKFVFTWRTEDNKSYINATVYGGVITSFNSSPEEFSSSSSMSFCPFSDSEYKTKAMNYVYQLNPGLKGMLSFISMRYSISSSDVRLYFSLVYKGVEIDDNSIYVVLDKETGELKSYSGDYWDDGAYTEPGTALSREEIQAIYREDVTLKPYYRISYDSEGNQLVNIVYTTSDSVLYDAATGEDSTIWDDYNKYMNTSRYTNGEVVVEEADSEESYDMGAGVEVTTATADVSFTESELKSMDEVDGLLSADEVTKLLYKDKYLGITSKYKLDSSYLTKSEGDDSTTYTWSLSYNLNTEDDYSYVSVNCDAISGKVISFYKSSASSKKEIDVDDANELAAAAAEYYMGDKFDEYVAKTSNTSPVSSTKDYTETSRTLYYVRYVNNIEVTGDTVNIRVNSAGEVTSFSYNYTDADFGDGKVISTSTAFDKLFEQKEMRLYYDGFRDLESKSHIYLLYTMDNWYINAKTGKLCNYNGIEITDSTTSDDCPYTDIEDSAYKDEIEILYRHGVFLTTEDTLSPKKAVTEKEFTAMLNSLMSSSYYYINSATDANTSVSITRTDMAKVLVNRLNLTAAAELDGIYKSPYSDVAEDDENVGYIAIAKAYGLLPNTDSISPDSLVSREYALHCIYNYVMANSEN